MSIVTVEGLVKRYGDTVAVDDVSFEVQAGEIFGILGRNGAGKTTTVECIEGLRHPDAGTIRVMGLDPLRDRRALREKVGAQLQQARLPEKLRVGEALALYRSFYRSGADSGELARALGLTQLLDRSFENLSGGEQQRLSVALALVGAPELAILDEITSGLDPRARRAAWDLIRGIRDEGVTVMLVTHFMDEAERLCDRIALMDRGRLVAVGTPAGLIGHAALGQRIRFLGDGALDPTRLASLPGVDDIDAAGHVTVTGTGDLVGVVLAEVIAQGVVPRDVQVQQPTLEDAFLALVADTEIQEVPA